ncbi:MAG: tetratricopeptide repeat protein [Myxococcota bacterium]
MRRDAFLDDRWIPTPHDPDAIRADVARWRDDLVASEAHAARSGEGSDQADVGRALKRLSEGLALLHRWEQARAFAARALGIWRDLGRERAAFLATAHLAKVEAYAGDLDRAAARFERLLEAAADPEHHGAIYRDIVRVDYACVLAHNGDPASARALLLAAVAGQTERGQRAQIAQTTALLERLGVLEAPGVKG